MFYDVGYSVRNDYPTRVIQLLVDFRLQRSSFSSYTVEFLWLRSKFSMTFCSK